MKETMSKAGYKYVGSIGQHEHVVQPINGQPAEVWANNKNHASYGIIYKNTHLEFMRTANDIEKLKAAATQRTFNDTKYETTRDSIAMIVFFILVAASATKRLLN